MNPEPLLNWSDPPMELIGFAAVFFMTGAVGFRFAALGRLGRGATPEESVFATAAARRAAWIGVLGAGVAAIRTAQSLPGLAERQHTTVPALLTGQPSVGMMVGLLLLALVGFLLAGSGARFGWWLALVGVVVSPFRSALLGQFTRVVNPAHEYAAGFWIGTLVLLVAFGLSPRARAALGPERHAAAAARMVNGFSVLAQVSVALLGIFGVITAVRHLKRLDAIWTTPYGWAFAAKMLLVLGVLGLGAWNWRRQKPRMGTPGGTEALRRSATAELALAMVVLLVTSVLVSLPSPR